MILLLLNFVSSRLSFDLNDQRRFINWMRTYQKFYIGDEYHFRLGIFITNLRYIQSFNRNKEHTFRVGINKFSCYTPSEYKSLLGLEIPQNYAKLHKNKPSKYINSDIPDSCDWRDHNAVTGIKDQGNCGGCWAFSAIATSESAYAIKSGNLISLSEQNLIDCAHSCSGCKGGWPQNALDDILKSQQGQFNSEGDYPYKAVPGYCNFDSNKAVGKVTEYISINSEDENDLKEKVALYGVASVCISAGNSPFMSYSGGILDDNDCNEYAINHAVAAVGYGVENGIDYWIVKNSWGSDWGEEGYVRMIRNKRNKCGIASLAIVAIS